MMENKIAIVTGGSSGIGRCTAEALRDAGCTVFELSRRDFTHVGIQHMQVDVTNEAAVQNAITQIAMQHGHIDIIVNCAGFGISGAVEFTELSEAKRQFDVNFFGMVNVNKAVIPVMRQNGSGRIVNISSVAAVAHIPFQTFYSASKAAIESYSCAATNEVKPFGISITCAQPGDICTGFTAARKKNTLGDNIYGGRISRSVAGMEKDEQRGMQPQFAGRYIAKIALKKKTKPIYTVGFGYKCLSMLCKFLPCGFRGWVVGLLYAR